MKGNRVVGFVKKIDVMSFAEGSSVFAVFYLPLDTEVAYRWTEGQTMCEDHGMSLPIVKTETDFDNLVVIKNNIAER